MLTNLGIEDKIKDFIGEQIPNDIIKQRDGGTSNGKKIMLDYISGSTCIDKLNSIFEYGWDWEVTEHFIQKSVDYQNKYMKEREMSPEPQPPVAHVFGILTVHLRDDKTGQFYDIKKTGCGSKVILGKANDQKDIFKAASTDALKKAASLIGVGLDLYRDANEQYYFELLLSRDKQNNFLRNYSDEEKKLYFDSVNYLQELTESNNDIDGDSMLSLLMTWSNNKYNDFNTIPPKELNSFVTHIKQGIGDDK